MRQVRLWRDNWNTIIGPPLIIYEKQKSLFSGKLPKVNKRATFFFIVAGVGNGSLGIARREWEQNHLSGSPNATGLSLSSNRVVESMKYNTPT